MFKLNQIKMLTFMLAFSVCFFKIAYAQPIFVSPNTCIPANPAVLNVNNNTYTLNPNGNTITSITALGDLTINSISPALPTTSTITITVRSKNFGRDTLNDCIGYLSQQSPNAKNFGFGKGVIRVGYTTGAACASSIDLSIFKTFSELPPVVGPKCVSPGDTITYSVCSILSVNQNANIGIDKYEWNQATGNININGLIPVYTSGDNSSVTFVVSTAISGTGASGLFTGGTLKCKFGACNGNTSSIDIGLKTKASPVTIAGLSPIGNSVCVPTSTNPISLIATPLVGTYTYSWSTNNPSWSFVSTGTGTATGASVNLNANESAGTVYLTTNGGCNVRVDTFQIKRTLAAPLTIKRTDTVTCVTLGSTLTFTVNNASNTANLGGVNFTWTAPAGWTINSPLNGPTVTITAAAAAVSGNITATSAGCTSGLLTTAVKIKPAKPTNIIGNTCIPSGTSTQIYSVTNVSGYTYFWNNTAGWTVNGTPNNSISYNANTASGMPNTISVRDSAFGGCFSDTAQLVVRVGPTAPTGITVTSVCGTATSCIPGGLPTTVVLTATGGSGTYGWTIPAGLGTLQSSTGNTAIVNCLGNPGTFSGVIVNCTNPPCSAASFSGSITVSPAATVDTSQNVLSGTNDLLKVNLNGGCTPTAYCWRLNNTGACISTSNQILLSSGATPPYSWTVQISYGTCSRFITKSTRFTNRVAFNNNGTTLSAVTINPNPASNVFTLVLPANTTNVSVSIYNSKGVLIKQQICKSGSNKFNTSTWANGEYIIKLISTKGEIITKKLVVNK
jgi:Secretion system C-terminal sorting domain/PKD-like domain